MSLPAGARKPGATGLGVRKGFRMQFFGFSLSVRFGGLSCRVRKLGILGHWVLRWYIWYLQPRCNVLAVVHGQVMPELKHLRQNDVESSQNSPMLESAPEAAAELTP